MNKNALAIHVAICFVVGGIIAFFTPAKWLAAAFWVSAAMYVNGAIATVEDGLPGGFENPDGADTPKHAKGWGATKFAISSFFIFVSLVTLGFLVQEYL